MKLDRLQNQMSLAVKRTMRTIVALIILVCSISVRGQLAGTHDYFSDVDGKIFHFEVSPEQLLKTPVWPLQDDSPPLSPRKAEKAATTEFHKLLKDTTDWVRTSIILDDMGDKVHWVYLVKFCRTRHQDGIPVPVEDTKHILTVVVLMDGTVIEPKITNVNSWPTNSAGLKTLQ